MITDEPPMQRIWSCLRAILCDAGAAQDNCADLVFKQIVDDYANWWAGEAMAAGLPQTAIAEALGYRTPSNLAIQLPYMRKFKTARLKVKETGKSQFVQTSNNRYVELFPSAKENTLEKETK